jgi:hypothetical protein
MANNQRRVKQGPKGKKKGIPPVPSFLNLNGQYFLIKYNPAINKQTPNILYKERGFTGNPINPKWSNMTPKISCPATIKAKVLAAPSLGATITTIVIKKTPNKPPVYFHQADWNKALGLESEAGLVRSI